MLYDAILQDEKATQAVTGETGLLLLASDLSVRAAACAEIGEICGKPLEEIFRIPPGEWVALTQYSEENHRDALLVQASETPLLVWGGHPLAGGLLVLVPPAEIRAALRAPLLYFQTLPLQLSAASLGAGAPYSAQEAPRLYAWLSDVRELFSPMTTAGSITEIIGLLHRRIVRLAQICGVAAEEELGSLGLIPLPEVDPNAFTLQLAAVFLLARRTAERSVFLLVTREGPDAPVLHAVLRLREAGDPMPELAGLADAAALRGNCFAASPVPEDPTLLHVRFTFTRKELSLQEMRNFFGWEESESEA